MTNDQREPDSLDQSASSRGIRPSVVGDWVSVIGQLQPTDAWVRALLVPAVVFFACGIDRNYQTDLWHHLARGRIIATEGHIPNTDRFTYTVRGQPFQDVNWLSQLLFFRIYQLGGLDLLQTVNAMLVAAVMALLVWLCRRGSGSLLLAAGVGTF